MKINNNSHSFIKKILVIQWLLSLINVFFHIPLLTLSAGF